MLSRSHLRKALEELESNGNAGRPVPLSPLREIEVSARHWAKEMKDIVPMRRLARLYRWAGDDAAALGIWQTAHGIDPRDMWTVIGLSNALDSAGETFRALELLDPLLDAPLPHAAVLAQSASLERKIGNVEKGIALRRRAARQDSKHWPALLTDLVAANKAGEALVEARRILAGNGDDAELVFRCYTALHKFSHDEGEVARAIERLMAIAVRTNDELIWRARVHRWEGRFDEALVNMSKAADARPDDVQLRRSLAWLALAVGNWGRDARILVDARRKAGTAPELRSHIDDADGLLAAFGGSLGQAAADPSAFAHVRSPESVFAYVVDTTPVAVPGWGDRQGIVMIAGSLAAGGAERVLATCFRHIESDERFGWSKLYLMELSPEKGKDFYLPLAGVTRSEIEVLDQDRGADAPLAWLPERRGPRTQRILDQLKADRPAIVHVWLEPLTALAGIAAILAGVPRIVLHTHNMRPADLNPEDPFVPRLRECYRALLKRPEVTLVCCADAAVWDYVEWIGLPDASKLRTLHNGFDASEIESAGGADATARLRTAYGLAPDSIVIGTAFRFSEVKRPLRWVEAAAIVARQRPECRFMMFGDGELRVATEESIKARGLNAQFILPGRVSDMYRQLPLLDLFVLSSRSEALPNVLLESQAAGVPVVAYDVGGVGETIIDGVTGLLVRNDTAEALSDAILRALDNRGWLMAASAAGKEFVRREFNTEKMITTLSDILLEGTGR